MLSPWLSLLLNRPELVVDHLAAYAELASEEAHAAAHAWIRLAAAWTFAVLMAAVAVALAGTAVMLAAAQSSHPWVWLAWVAVPLTAAALALAAWTWARRMPATTGFDTLRQQWQADRQAFLPPHPPSPRPSQDPFPPRMAPTQPQPQANAPSTAPTTEPLVTHAPD